MNLPTLNVKEWHEIFRTEEELGLYRSGLSQIPFIRQVNIKKNLSLKRKDVIFESGGFQGQLNERLIVNEDERIEYKTLSIQNFDHLRIAAIIYLSISDSVPLTTETLYICTKFSISDSPESSNELRKLKSNFSRDLRLISKRTGYFDIAPSEKKLQTKNHELSMKGTLDSRMNVIYSTPKGKLAAALYLNVFYSIAERLITNNDNQAIFDIIQNKTSLNNKMKHQIDANDITQSKDVHNFTKKKNINLETISKYINQNQAGLRAYALLKDIKENQLQPVADIWIGDHFKGTIQERLVIAQLLQKLKWLKTFEGKLVKEFKNIGTDPEASPYIKQAIYEYDPLWCKLTNRKLKPFCYLF